MWCGYMKCLCSLRQTVHVNKGTQSLNLTPLLPDYWRCGRGVVAIPSAQFYSTIHERMFCAISNPACSVWEVCDGVWQWFRLEIRLNAFHRPIIPQKQWIIIMSTINCTPGSSHWLCHLDNKYLPQFQGIGDSILGLDTRLLCLFDNSHMPDI